MGRVCGSLRGKGKEEVGDESTHGPPREVAPPASASRASSSHSKARHFPSFKRPFPSAVMGLGLAGSRVCGSASAALRRSRRW